MIRVVLDTNILVSALISPFGNEAQVVHAIQSHWATPCFSAKMLVEYAEVLARPKFSFTPEEVGGLIDLLRRAGELIEPQHLAGSPDPKDDEFIACAISCGARFLVTGNKRHFPAAICGAVQVVSSREALQVLSKLQSQ
jgi:putative PIN family toxin of toxin-antitoxin system